MDIKIHPAAEIFPMLSSDQFQRLKVDIERNGQRDEIVLFDGKILDGRNRYKACLEIGLQPDCCELEECDDPVGYVLSKNLHRREMRTSQKAMCAAKMANLGEGRPAKTAQICAVSTDDAAKTFGVSRRAVQSALTVLREGSSELVRQCEQGSVAVSLACKLIEAEPDKKSQASVAKQGRKAIKEHLADNDEINGTSSNGTASPPVSQFHKLWKQAGQTEREAIRKFILEDSQVTP